MKTWRVVRQFGADIDQHREDVYRVESVGMMTQREAVALAARLEEMSSDSTKD